MYNLVIRGGKVLDGTGSPWFSADLAVEDDAIRLLPAGSRAEAKQVIDAQGLIVAPGFVDLHTHASLLPFSAPAMEPLVRQGVTTVLVGVDGYSCAPFPSADLFHQAMQMHAGLEGTLPEAPGWANLDGYLRDVDRRSACNVATLVGNGTLRLAATGWQQSSPSEEELEGMGRALAESMEQGAFGLSSGLTYPPSSYAQNPELAHLCQVIQPFSGLYVTHLRASLGDRLLDPMREAIGLARETGVTLHVAHLSTPRPGGAARLLDILDQARSEGADATFDAHPYPYTTTPLAALLPAWAMADGPHALRRRLRDRKERLRIARDPAWLHQDFRSFLVTNLSRKKYQPYDGWPVQSVAQALGESLVNVVSDLLLEENFAVSCVGLGGNPVNIRKLFAHPAHLVASASVLIGTRCNPRSYGAFPRVLGEMCREEALLSLPDAVRRMTSLPARRLGLKDRGILWDGMKADIVVFDPERVASRADLEEPRQFPEGIAWVMVNGVPVVTPAGQTGATPGRALRRR